MTTVEHAVCFIFFIFLNEFSPQYGLVKDYFDCTSHGVAKVSFQYNLRDDLLQALIAAMAENKPIGSTGAGLIAFVCCPQRGGGGES